MYLAHYEPVFDIIRKLWDAPDLQASQAARGFLPRADVVEHEKEWVFHVDLPGIERDKTAIEVKGDRLHVSGSRESEKSEAKDGYRYTERSSGVFERDFSLPPDADPKDIRASSKDGVLTIRVAKRHETQPVKIAIEHEG